MLQIFEDSVNKGVHIVGGLGPRLVRLFGEPFGQFAFVHYLQANWPRVAESSERCGNALDKALKAKNLEARKIVGHVVIGLLTIVEPQTMPHCKRMQLTQKEKARNRASP